MAKEHYWFYPVSLMVKKPFNTIALLGDYRGYLHVIHGSEDEIVPFRLGEIVFQKARTEKKEITAVSGAGHNDLFHFPQTYDALYAFLKQQ